MDTPKEQISVKALYAKVREKGFARTEHFLQESQCAALASLAEQLTQNSRKVTLEGQQIEAYPELLRLCSQLGDMQESIFYVPNTVIVKYYDPRELQVSAAYDFHKDPERFIGYLNLLSLTGHALLEVKDVHGDPHSFHCRPGTLVTIVGENGGVLSNENPEHRVTQPAKERRYFIFIGMSDKQTHV